MVVHHDSGRMGSIVWGRDIAAVYDTVNASGFAPEALDPMVDLLVGLADDGPALELAVGTGRVALALSARGVPVHGIELSPHMAELLRGKPGAEAVPVTVGDMTSTRLSTTFRLVYLVANTIMNVTTQEEQEQSPRTAARRGGRGGGLGVELFPPRPPGAARHEKGRVFTLDPDHVGI